MEPFIDWRAASDNENVVTKLCSLSRAMPDTEFYEKEAYFATASGNRVARSSVLCGAQNIRLQGKTIIREKTVLRGDLGNLTVGKFTYIGSNCTLRPCTKQFKAGVAFYPLSVGAPACRAEK